MSYYLVLCVCCVYVQTLVVYQLTLLQYIRALYYYMYIFLFAAHDDWLVHDEWLGDAASIN